MRKIHPEIGCCGIDCGLCPRFYTQGNSRCPGCGGEGFEVKHPPCAVKTCCADKHELEACGQCAEYPCQKYENKEKIQRDSFVTHKGIFQNHEYIKDHGLDNFIAEQNGRIIILRELLTSFDDGRSKGFYCLAAALLPPEQLRAAIDAAVSEDDKKTRVKILKTTLQKYAEAKGVVLSLRKGRNQIYG